MIDWQICVMLCADHGPCVSGAHNTIVTARAGKDLVSSLVSGTFFFIHLLSFLLSSLVKRISIIRNIVD